MNRTLTLKSLSLVLLCTLLFSCAAAAVGIVGAAGGYVYVNGQLKDTIQAPLPGVREATVRAFKSLDFHVRQNRADKLKGKLTAEMADGTKVFVKLKAEDFETTRIKIRVGYFGDKELSIQILNRIKGLL